MKSNQLKKKDGGLYQKEQPTQEKMSDLELIWTRFAESCKKCHNTTDSALKDQQATF